MVREAERIRYSRGYLVIIETDEGKKITEKFNSLSDAQQRYKYHYEYLRWSLAHKLGMGIPKEVNKAKLVLWDKAEGFELEEEEIAL